MGAIWTLGPHKMWFEEPDTLRLVTVGVYDMKLLEESNAIANELKKLHPTLYLISDSRQGTGMSADVRKLLGEKPEMMPYAGSVMFGSSFAMRTMVNMMIRAGELMGRKADTEFAMVATEEDAKAWVAERRAKKAK
ncbi:STAS/SEC14 domain-containing protein [Pyxidicoccus parkwayensis]|uniref:STAS/SEC14 domain-containing protein n=1 Tax=Pyxidicoccus parkwayensis TaxID=2813578 RepID=A0ABX7PB55_9BACT|nr:STAS/SEC14 domain-containing protein [Pyxidicoccus parkwaysis]QSQ27706.1 STAS/SEC14 domain-containing protein [Pyxidicoccus parkwaysis]